MKTILKTLLGHIVTAAASAGMVASADEQTQIVSGIVALVSAVLATFAARKRK